MRRGRRRHPTSGRQDQPLEAAPPTAPTAAIMHVGALLGREPFWQPSQKNNRRPGRPYRRVSRHSSRVVQFFLA
jgi:hypothetical protein